AREAAASCFDAVAAEFDPQARPDVIILATPVRAILQWLRALPAQIAPGTLILDLGSSKREIVALMDALPDSLLAVGGHPMCGKESSGPGEAESSLFVGRPFVLCRTIRTTTAAWDFAIQIVAALDAQLVNLDAEQHDQAVAAISHLPYLVSSGLVATVQERAREDDAPWRLASTGFRDTSRMAGSNVTMMADTLLTNRDSVLDSLASFRKQLEQIEAALRSSDEWTLRAILDGVHEARNDWFRQWNAARLTSGGVGNAD
ncbi:MAG TPA: prephenate dehydrogenase, partial [Aggregatilineales bacterium]|nr:prephenate dehydrogenase [Aggregatilineales bacterium]